MTDKIVLPESLHVAGLDYKVFFPHEFADSIEVLGLHSGLGTWIRIGDTKVGSRGSKDNQVVLEIFLHEMLHAVDFCYCGDVLNEGEIEIFTRALYQILADNKLNLKSNGLPETVRICGATFTVTDAYKYEEIGEVSSHVNFEAYQIFVGKEMNGVKLSDQFIKLTFMYTLIQSMLYKYMSDKDLENLRDKLKTRSLASGLYQVIKDNNIEELFDKWTK
jgi:hypothetical protein